MIYLTFVCASAESQTDVEKIKRGRDKLNFPSFRKRDKEMKKLVGEGEEGRYRISNGARIDARISH